MINFLFNCEYSTKDIRKHQEKRDIQESIFGVGWGHTTWTQVGAGCCVVRVPVGMHP